MFPLAVKGQSVTVRFGPSAPDHDGGFVFHRFPGLGDNFVFPPFWGYPSNYPFTYFYPGLWPPLEYQHQEAVRIAHGDIEAHVADQEKEYLASQVQALTNEIRSLREQQAEAHYAPAQAGPATGIPARPSTQAEGGAQEKFPSTVFVFQDGREMEVRDYAVFGNTLWVFKGDTARKFPLSDFNLPASRQVNEEHGVEFPLGKKR
jgi:hypothetical protein